MRYLYIPLVSLLVGLSSCSFLARADETQIKKPEYVKSSASLKKQVSNPQSEEINMKKTIESYVRGADEQNIELVESVFHNNFQVFAHSEGSVRVLDKQTYLKLLETGKIGGSKRQIEYLDIHADDLVGTARINLVGETVTFHDHLNLIKENGSWKIVSNATYVVPNQ